MAIRIIARKDRPLVIGGLVLLTAISFVVSAFGERWVDSITVNSEHISRSDPRFASELKHLKKLTFGTGCAWLLSAVGAVLYWRFKDKRESD